MHFIYIFLLGLSTGWSGSGLCPTRNQPDQIGWTESQPTADREDDLIGRVETPTEFGWVGQGPKSGKQQESGVDPAKSRQDLDENGIDLAGSTKYRRKFSGLVGSG